MEFLQFPAIAVLSRTVCYHASHHLTQQQEKIISITIFIIRSKGGFTVLLPGVEGKQFFKKGNHLSSATSHFNRLLFVFLFVIQQLIIGWLLLGWYCDSAIVYLRIGEVVVPGQREGRVG
jgi:hypothetical protein